MSRIVLGELYAGAFHSQNPDRHYRKIASFTKLGHVLEIDEETQIQYGKIWAQLANLGKLIPTNDIWIAALALQHGLTLVSLDKHFERVPGLKHATW